MSVSEINKIKETFTRLGLKPEYLEHEPVITSEDAAKTRGFSLKQGIKALLFTNGRGAWAIVNVPADKKVQQKKVADACGWTKRDIRMATAEEVIEVTGCEVGSVPPFDHKTPVQIYVDSGVYDNQDSAFNIGLRTNSVKIPTSDMRIVFKDVGAIEGNFAKDEQGKENM